LLIESGKASVNVLLNKKTTVETTRCHAFSETDVSGMCGVDFCCGFWVKNQAIGITSA
jgi:hypothetical protein